MRYRNAAKKGAFRECASTGLWTPKSGVSLQMFCSYLGIGGMSQQPCRDCREVLVGYSRRGPGEMILQDRYSASSEPVAQLQARFRAHPRSFPLGSAIALPIANVTSADAQVMIGVNQIALIAAGTWRYFSIIRNCNGLAAFVQRLGTTEVMTTTPAEHAGHRTFPIPEPESAID